MCYFPGCYVRFATTTTGDPTETESEAEMSSWDQATRGEKLGLVWRNRKKISQIVSDYLNLPFFLLKVHKIEIFFGFDFEICIISLLVMSKY